SGEVEEYAGWYLVLASGETAEPRVPQIEGLESFNGKVIHSTGYNNGKEFKDKLVLVVGSGNSGMEIALDLSNFGAKPSIIVRSPIGTLISTFHHEDETIDVGTVKKIKSREIQVLPAEIDRKVSEVMKFCSEMANHAHSTQLFSAHASRDQLKSGFSFPNHWKGRNGLNCVGLSRRGFFGANMDAELSSK
ncbi:Flavin-containing monooxygenase YUCCA10, partial [Glycine soja]